METDEASDAVPDRRRGTSPVRPAVGAVAALAMVITLFVTGLEGESNAANGYRSALGDKQLRIMAPANPGGGWDARRSTPSVAPVAPSAFRSSCGTPARPTSSW